MIAGPLRSPHGYWSMAGSQLVGSKHIYAEHLGQWLTATRGGVGHNFFADAEHHPVRFKPGIDIPAQLNRASPEQLAGFEEILIYGEGTLPAWLNGWREESRAGPWRNMFPRRGSALPLIQFKTIGVSHLVLSKALPSLLVGIITHVVQT